MPGRPPPGTLPIDAVARIVRATPTNFRSWLRDGPLDFGARGCGELDALKAALWKSLSDTLGPKQARLAFKDVLRALEDRLPTGRLDVVYDFANGAAHVCSTDREVALASLSGGHVHAIGLGDELERVRVAFRKHLGSQGPTPVRTRRPARTSQAP